LATAILLFVVFHAEKPPEGISYSRFISDVQRGEISQITVKYEGTTYALVGTPNPNPAGGGALPGKVMARVPPTALDGNGWTALQSIATQYQAELEYQPSSNYFFQIFLSFAPYILIFLIIWFFFLRQIRSAGGGIGMLGNFGRSRHRLLSKEHTNITFNDVAGIDEAKEELSEIVEFLKNPKKFQRLGGRIPRGVLLIGDPGVGKTLLAK